VIRITFGAHLLGNPRHIADAQRRIPAVTSSLKSFISLRSLLAFALMFWCAGTGCMIVSYARVAASDLSVAVSASDSAMAGSLSMDAHACCKAKRPAKKAARANSESKASSLELNLLAPPSTPTQTGVMNCCPLTSGSVVVSSRSQSHDNATVLEQLKSSSYLHVNSEPVPLLVPLRLPNRAHSYLLDCAFLI